MPKKFIFLLLLLFFVFAGIIALFFINNQLLSLPARTLFTSHPTPSPLSVNFLSFSPTNLTVTKGQINTLAIDFRFTKQKNYTPQIVQLELSYDPLAISDVTLAPGDFFTHPTVVLNQVNQRTGRISYALEFEDPKAEGTVSGESHGTNNESLTKQSGTVAIISFTPQASFINKQTTITFLPKTMVRENKNTKSITKVSGATLIFASFEQK